MIGIAISADSVTGFFIGLRLGTMVNVEKTARVAALERALFCPLADNVYTFMP